MGKFSGENLVALICCIIVIYMIVGGGYTFIKNLITDTKLTLIIFIAVPIILVFMHCIIIFDILNNIGGI